MADASDSGNLARTRSVYRAMALLAAIADSPGPPRLVDLARQTGLSSSTCLRILRTLEDEEFVKRTEAGTYSAGGRLLQLSLRAVAHVPLIERARRSLTSLADITGESSYLGLPGPNDTVLYAASAESANPVRHVSWPGRLIPRKGTAIGAALDGLVDARGVAVSSKTIVDEATAIAAPVFDWSQTIVAAVSVVGPTFRFTPEKIDRIVELLTQVTRELSHDLSRQGGAWTGNSKDGAAYARD